MSHARPAAADLGDLGEDLVDLRADLVEDDDLLDDPGDLDDSGDLDDLAAIRPARRRLPWFRMALGSAAIVAGLAHLAERRQAETGPVTAQPVPASALTAPPSPWEPIPSAEARFALEGLGSVEQESRRHAEGGREDTLLAGSPGEAGHMRLRVRRAVPEPVRSSLYVDLARQAAEAGLSVARLGQSAPLTPSSARSRSPPSRWRRRASRPARPSASSSPSPAFAVQGWLCGTAETCRRRRPTSPA